MPKGYYTPLSKTDEEKIKNEYLTKPVKKLASEIGTTYGRIMRYLSKKGLDIPPKIIEKRKRDSQMKKGHIPFNKGKKQSEFMSEESIQKTKKTRFKKGNLPHNTNSEGNGAIVKRKDTTGRPYKYIRIDIGRWELYHRFLWEKHNGPIPDTHIVVFKDGDTLNTNLDNLQLITREENMYRNSKHNFPSDIIPSLVLINQLEKKLNTLKNDKEHTIGS